MTKNVKLNPESKRVTILLDRNVYQALHQKRLRAKGKPMKMFQYLNDILAREVDMAVPTYLRHPSTKAKNAD